jgi:dephospho-CoA kinase
MILLGLTGSIGMGKSTTAAMFAEDGVPVWSADGAVHDLYGPGGAAVGPVGRAFPGVAGPEGIDRKKLSDLLLKDPAAFERLEAIVHPLVSEDRREFLERARKTGAAVALIDVPLLFEGDLHGEADAVVVVSAPAEIQKKRVLARPGMTAAKLKAILDRQTPDAEKRARADFVIDTGKGKAAAREQVRRILAIVRDPAWRPKAELEGPGEAHH